jgi:hypothetical protein
VAPGGGARRAEVNEWSGSDGAQMGYGFSRGGDKGDGERGRTWDMAA